MAVWFERGFRVREMAHDGTNNIYLSPWWSISEPLFWGRGCAIGSENAEVFGVISAGFLGQSVYASALSK